MPSSSRHVKLALHADNTAVIATSRQPALFVKCLETYLSDLERWLREWRIAINVMLFAKDGRRISKPWPAQLFGEPIQWVDTARYLGVTFDKRLTWSTHIDQVRKKAAQRLGVLGSVLNRRSSLSIRNGVLLYKQFFRPMMDYSCPLWRSALTPISGNCRCFSPSLIKGKFTMIWESHTLPTISDIWEIRLKVSWRGEPHSYAARQIFSLTESWSGSPKAGKSGSTTCPGYSQDGHVDTLNRVKLALFDCSDWGFPCFFLSCKANANV